MAALGSGGHRAIIEHVTAHYRGDARVLAVAVFGSVSTGTWHELSDVDLDIVTADHAVMRPGDEVAALFGPRAVIALTRADSADIVLDSLEEVSVRWHPLGETSPNICTSVRVVDGGLPDAEVVAAGVANRGRPDAQRLLDALVRDAIGAAKYLARGRRWEAAAAVERMRRSLLELRGRRDTLQLDPADPVGALAAVLAEAQAGYDLGPARRALLDQIGPDLAGPAGLACEHEGQGLGLDGMVREAAPEHLFARAMAVNSAGLLTLQALGFAFAGALGAAAGPGAAIAIAGVCGIAAVACLHPRAMARAAATVS